MEDNGDSRIGEDNAIDLEPEGQRRSVQSSWTACLHPPIETLGVKEDLIKFPQIKPSSQALNYR